MYRGWTAVAALILWFSCAAQAQSTSRPWPTKTRFGLTYAVFGGDKYKSISNESAGFGGEVGILKGDWRMLNLAGKVRGLHISGEDTFLDGTTEVDTTYTVFLAEPGLGLHLNLMPYTPPGIRVYLSGYGLISYQHLQLASGATLTNLNRSETTIGTGYEIGAGVEWNFKTQKSFWAMWGEIQYRDVTSELVGQSAFRITGLQMVGGIAW